MRLFIAVDFDETVRSAIAAAVGLLRDRAEARSRGSARGVKWVDARNLHLTLHFIGELEDERVPGLTRVLAPALGLEDARVGFGGWGVFPPRGPARVIWLGITGGTATLTRAHAAIAGRLAGEGLTLESGPWSPHLTVGRVKVPSGQLWSGLTREAAPQVDCEGAISACTLYRSHLSPSGPTYEALLRIPFAAAAGPAPSVASEADRDG